MKRSLLSSLTALLACSSSAGAPGNPPTPPSTQFTLSPGSLPSAQSSAPQPTTNTSMPASSTVAPQNIQETFAAGSLFPVGFTSVDLDWRAEDLIKHRPWVSNEGNFAPYLSYLYREASYGVATGQFNNQWLIDHKVFNSIEYHFQHDSTGKPTGPLHKVVFIFEVSLPKEAVEQIRKAASVQWGEFELTKDEFGLEFTRWKQENAEIRFYYSPTGSIPETIEIIRTETSSQ
jgi:hypothetical protein